MQIISSRIEEVEIGLNNNGSKVEITQPQGVINLIGTFIMFFLYFIYLFKIMMLSFFRRRKFNIKQRTYRKFIFAHQEILRYFTDEDKSIMQVTLNNTMKNASPNVPVRSSRLRKPAKTVSFQTRKNQYFQPKVWKDQQQQNLKPNLEMERQDKLNESFEQKKIQDQHIQRTDLLEIDQKSDQSLKEEQQPKDITYNNETEQLLIDDI